MGLKGFFFLKVFYCIVSTAISNTFTFYSILNFFEVGSCHVAHAGLESIVLLPQPPDAEVTMMRLSLAFMPTLKPQFAFPVLIALADHPSAIVTNSRDGSHPGFLH